MTLTPFWYERMQLTLAILRLLGVKSLTYINPITLQPELSPVSYDEWFECLFPQLSFGLRNEVLANTSIMEWIKTQLAPDSQFRRDYRYYKNNAPIA